MRSDKELEKDQMKEKTEHMCKKMKKEDLLLYAVTDRHWLNGETLYSQVEKTLEGGTTFVQLREKELDEAHFLKEAKEIKELCARYRVPFVINDNVDIALEMDADERETLRRDCCDPYRHPLDAAGESRCDRRRKRLFPLVSRQREDRESSAQLTAINSKSE